MSPVSWLWRTRTVPLLLAAAISIAERADAAGDDGDDPDVVDVIGKRPEPGIAEPKPSEEPTAFGTVIRSEDFAGEKLGVAELLLQAPGTRVRRSPGGSTLMLRGASTEHTLIFLDGIRINSAAGGGLDLRTLPPGLIDRITVLRGNEGARYGAGALGGVALLTTRPVEDGAISSGLTLTGGSFGTLGLDGTISGGSQSLAGLAAISLQQSEGGYPARFDPTPASDPTDIRWERLTNNDHQSAGLLLKGMARVESVRIHAMTQGSVAERGLPGTLYWRDTQRRGERRGLAAIRLEPAEPADHTIYGGLELRRDEVSVWGGDTSGTISQPASDGDGHPWQVENALELTLGAESAPVSWTLLRVEARAGGEWLDSPYHGDRSRERFSASFADELYLGRMITLAPAIRYDRIGTFDGLSPKIGLSVRPHELLEFKANAGRSFRVPSFGELYLFQGPLRPNPRLRPERGYTLDAGVVLRRKGLLVQLAGFYSRTEDLISYEVVSGGISRPFNFLDGEVVGGEAEAIVQPISWLTLSTSYSLAHTTNLRDDPRYFGKELPYRPPHRFLARAALRRDGVESFVEGSHQSAQFVNRSNTGQHPSQTSMRAGAGARLWRGSHDLWLSGQIENAFDAELIDQLGFPQPGRAFFLTLRLSPPGTSGGA